MSCGNAVWSSYENPYAPHCGEISSGLSIRTRKLLQNVKTVDYALAIEIREYLDYEEGHDKKKNLIKEYFCKGLLELVQQENYGVQNLFNNKIIEWLKKLYTLKELKEFKKLFVRARDNLTLTIEKFPG